MEREKPRKQPTLGFAARETATGSYKFQAVIFTASRTSEPMTKTFDPHGRLLTEQETRELGYDTTRLIEQAKQQRISLPEYQWRHHVIAWEDLW